MKSVIVLIAFLCSKFLVAQNWAPFSPSETYCYQSDTSAVIDIAYRFDSLTLAGEDTFYNFNTIIQSIDDESYLKYGAILEEGMNNKE